MATASAPSDDAAGQASDGDTIATVDVSTGRLVPPLEPFGWGVVWGPRPTDRCVMLERPKAQQTAVDRHGQLVALYVGPLP